MNCDPKVVPLFKGKVNPKYANVPDSLKWAIPMMEAQDSPAVKAAHKASEARAKARFEAKLKAKTRASLTVIS
jgi:hypothetical protein